jgi:hypothetical protein
MSKTVSISINLAFVALLFCLGFQQDGLLAVFCGFSAGMNAMNALRTWREE